MDESGGASSEDMTEVSRQAEGDGAAPRKRSDHLGRLLKARQSWILTALLFLATCYTLILARDFLLPIVFALIAYFILSPVVRALCQSLRLPPTISAAVILMLLFAIAILGFVQLAEPASEWMTKARPSLRTVERKLGELRKPVEEVSRAAEEVENLTRMDTDDSVQEVEIKAPGLGGTLVIGTQKLLVSGAVVVILLYFLLASGDRFLAQLVTVVWPLGRRTRAKSILRATEREISAYLATVTVINAVLGAVVGLALYWLEVPNPVLWGVLAGILNFVPYFGALIGIGVVGLMAIVTFDSLSAALVPPAIYFLLTALEGSFVTPMILGRRFSINPVVIVLWLLFWGWTWGIAGALLAMPLLTAVRILSEHVQALAPVSKLLTR